jgi:alkanesulfonate monooxygenase SsuD/methylene tetrahydromethanopterin reductase-like flavin-dependent oxidoreductase (luciferase family)
MPVSMDGKMDFSIQLSAYYPDKSYGGDRLYRDMLDQAVLADRLGYDALSITEHHCAIDHRTPSDQYSADASTAAVRGQDRRDHRADKNHDLGRGSSPS